MPRRNYRLERNKEERALRRIFVSVMRKIANRLKLTEVDVSSPELVMQALDMDTASMGEMLEQVRKTYMIGGSSASKRAATDFDVRSATAAAWLQEHGARLVTNITNQQREAIAAVITAGLGAGRTPRQIATDIVGKRGRNGARRGGIVGLTGNQAEYVINMRKELAEGSAEYFTRARRNRTFDRTIRRRMREGLAIPAAMIEGVSAAYADNLLLYRGETIAQTETAKAFNAGRDAVWRQAVDKGKAQREEVRRVWRAINDSRTRDQHADMDGQEVGLDEPFIDGDGNRLMYPGDDSLGAPAGTLINCLHPSTRVAAVGGLRGMIRREYSGQIIEVSAGSDIHFAVTTDHPVLSDRGWISASMIDEGDCLINCGLRGKFLAVAENDIDDIYPTAQELYSAGHALHGGKRTTAIVVDFDGNHIGNEDVHVVSQDGMLLDGLDSAITKALSEFSLAETDVSAGGLGLFTHVLLGKGVAAVSPDGSMRGLCSILSLLFGHLGGRPPVPFGYAWASDAKVVEARINNTSRPADFLGYSKHRIPLVEKALDVLKIFGASAHVSRSSGRPFSRERVTNVRSFHYDGPVYDFHSKNGLLIVGNSIHHNCRCMVQTFSRPLGVR